VGEQIPGNLYSRAFSSGDAAFPAGEHGWENEEAVTGKLRPKPQFPPLYNDSEEDRKQAIILRLSNLINSFRHRGHFAAMLDPIRGSCHQKLHPNEPIEWSIDPDNVDVVLLLKNYPESMDLTVFGLEGVDINEKFQVGDEFLGRFKRMWSIAEIVEFMRGSYCGAIAVEYTHLSDRFQRRWIKDRFESQDPLRNRRVDGTGINYRGKRMGVLTHDQRKSILEVVVRADHFERFLGAKFPAVKRFGLEGAETLIAGLHGLVGRSTELGVMGVELGMAHRGRLNVLANVFKKPLGAICNEFHEVDELVGDVKYHLGTYSEVKFGDKTVHMNLAANPSHLEAVNAVVAGKTRAKQFLIGDKDKRQVMAVLLHGDAAFSGQGIVAEVMEISDLPSYSIGGTVHVVVNNMIGFTTDPRASRSSYHCTNVAKGIEAPIFHVNGDDAEAVFNVCLLAADWRAEFAKDCVVDIVCYRRHGHNELDEPSFTQPLTYSEIARHQCVLEILTRELITEEVVDAQYVKDLSIRVWREFEEEYGMASQYIPDVTEWLSSNWQGQAINALLNSGNRPYNLTGCPIETLTEIGKAAFLIPEGFNAHPNICKIFQEREKRLDAGEVDMATAELLAFGTLMLPFHPDDPIGRIKRISDPGGVGYGCTSLSGTQDAMHNSTPEMFVEYQDHPTVDVRLSGQDSERGTFNQRHAVIYDQTTAQPYTPLNNLKLGPQATLQVCNSSLSEAAVLGFEYGYSLESDLALTIWEAQFGDFANVAQHIIDNFIATGEAKWNQKSGLVLLLPHGFDGQGPEHSSAKLERFLQLVDDDPDSVPWAGPLFDEQLEHAWNLMNTNGEETVTTVDIVAMLQRLGGESEETGSRPQQTAHELGDGGKIVGDGTTMTKEEYFHFAAGWMRRNDERTHNLCVVNCTTPANYFHALRRQIHRPFAKPLIVMACKYLLHHRPCRSPLKHLGPNTFFRRTILEGGPGDNMPAKITLVPPNEIKRIVLLSGQIFYELFHARTARKRNDITFLRLEQIAPFPFDRIARILDLYPGADIVWAQEEPKNMGAYTYVAPRLRTSQMVMSKRGKNHEAPRPVRYIGRPTSASPATGLFKMHRAEMKAIVDDIFDYESAPQPEEEGSAPLVDL